MKNQYFRKGTYRLGAVWCGILFLGVGLLGCGGDPSLPSVSGRVTVNGQPLEGLAVMFAPLDEETRPSSGTCDANGNYRAMSTRERAGATVGRNRVTFLAPPDPQKLGPMFDMPPEYADEESTLEYTVTAGRNSDVDFDLDIPDLDIP